MGRTYYVDVIFGNDATGDGSVARPYKTIQLAASLLNHGDEIAVNDIGADEPEVLFYEATTIELINKVNISLRFLRGAGKKKTSMVWKPTLVNPSRRASLFIYNCSDVRIDGAIFMSQSPLTDHAYAVRIENSNNVTVSGCAIHSAWEVDNSAELLLNRLHAELSGITRTVMEFLYGYGGVPQKTVAQIAVEIGRTEDYVQNLKTQFENRLLFLGSGELFSAVNSTVTFSGCSVVGVNNSYSNYLAAIAVDGAGDYNLFANTITNLRANNGVVYGVKIGAETRKVMVDGLLVHDIKTDLADSAIGLQILSDNSQVEFVVNGAQFSGIHTGIQLQNIPNGVLPKRIKRCSFFGTRRAIVALHSEVDIRNISVHSLPKINHTYPPGHTYQLDTYGIFADDYSRVNIMNSVLTSLGYAFYAAQHSLITVEYSIWNLCTELRYTLTGGKINTAQYVRRLDPKYVNLWASPYGDFSVQDYSPCIDAGKRYEDPFIGLAPDIGVAERSRAFRIDDLPALISRTGRYATRVPLTDIDVMGMIVQGIETYDPEIQAGREGSAIKDIAVKPLTSMLLPYVTELEAIRNSLSFLNVDKLSDETADALAANLFVTRRSGSIASGIVRVYFENPSSAVIPAESEFRNGSGKVYYTRQETAISAEEMALNFEDNLYYVDAIVEAKEPGIEYNTEARTVSTPLTPLPTGVVSVTNPQAIVGGENKETNAELKERIKTAITVRDLVTKKGITYVIPDLFPFVREIRPIGFRDPEMLRDEVLGYHIGGKVDIYVKPNALVEDSKLIEEATAEIPLNIANWGNVPIVQISKIEVLDPATLDSIDVTIPESHYSIRVNNPKTRFSIDEDNTLLISNDYVGMPIRIYYKWASDIRALQQWVENSDHRVVCADLLVKHFLPTFVDFNISYYCDKEIEALDGLLAIFVSDIKNGFPLQVSDIVDYCYSFGIDYVEEPIMLVGNTHMSNGAVVTLESETELVIERTSIFVPNTITVNYMGPDPNK